MRLATEQSHLFRPVLHALEIWVRISNSSGKGSDSSRNVSGIDNRFAKSRNLHAELGQCDPIYESHNWDEECEKFAEYAEDSSVVFRKLVFQFYQVAVANRVNVLTIFLLCR